MIYRKSELKILILKLKIGRSYLKKNFILKFFLIFFDSTIDHYQSLNLI